jgi:hypothetical protein
MDADVEAGSILVGMEGDNHGHVGIRSWWEHLLDVFPDFAIDVVEVRDLRDLTFAAVRLRGHGADSQTPFEMPLWFVARWRLGKCLWWRSYATRAEALKAVRQLQGITSLHR